MARALLVVMLLGSCAAEEAVCRTGALTCRDALADRFALADKPAVDRSANDGPRERPALPSDTASHRHEEITPATLKGWLDSGKALTLVDVREPAEYATGHIAGALNLAWSSGVLKASLSQIAKDRPVVVYCASGSRSDQAATWLALQGLKPVYDMGGIAGWIAAGYPTVK